MCNEKKKKILITTFVFFVFSIISYAASLGTLDYWISDELRISRWSSSVKVISSLYSVDFDDFHSSVDYAISGWNNAGINVSKSTTSSYDIIVHGGTYNQLKPLYPSLSTTATGLCSTSGTYEGTYSLEGSGTTISGYLRSSGKIALVDKNRTSNQYKNTALHELGHALGWDGHSSSSSDVMYPSATSITSLSSRDKRHLLQVY